MPCEHFGLMHRPTRSEKFHVVMSRAGSLCRAGTGRLRSPGEGPAKRLRLGSRVRGALQSPADSADCAGGSKVLAPRRITALQQFAECSKVYGVGFKGLLR